MTRYLPLIAAVILVAACGQGPSAAPASAATPGSPASLVSPAPPASPGTPALPASSALPARVRVSGVDFVNADGTPFDWRGITAFRLVEQVAHGREAEAIAYLDWAKSSGLTVVRVLAMAKHLFELAPEDGLAALPRLLALASERGLHVEVVALADTGSYELDLDAHVSATGKIAGAHPNAFLEIANEPFHHTQHAALHDRATLARLAALVPDEVLVAYGSDKPEASGGGDYVTVHMPRGGAPWEHVKALASGAALVASYARPVVSDEPIGAARVAARGRRDNAPERFRAAALLTRMTGMYATFHYDGGLQAEIPEGPELEAFEAWREAWTLLPGRPDPASFRAVADESGGRYEVTAGDTAWTLSVQTAASPADASLVKRWEGSALFRSPIRR